MKKLFRLAVAVTMGVGVAIGGAQTSQAQSDVTGATARRTVDLDTYWSASRMKSALPGDTLVRGHHASGVPASTQRRAIPGRAPQVNASAKKIAQPQATQVSPRPTIGKVFFTLGGQDYVCSGNVVTSTNRSVVTTAGHCVNEGPGAFATNWVFVPAYQNGSAPYGRWAARNLYTSSQWASKGDITYDVGFAVIAKNAQGKALGDVVGSTGIEFGAARGQYYRSYGYPAARPFTGQTLQSCQGYARNDPRQASTQGIPCDMTGGSSGGPWFLSNGNQNSVNSYGYPGTNIMYGPYYGDVAMRVFQNASAA